MKNVLRIGKSQCLILISVMLFFSNSVVAQQGEVVIVYDTVYVYDTVHVYTAHKELLAADPLVLNKKMIKFFNEQTATFPITAILIKENINNLNSIKMKKITFMSLLAFSFNSVVIAQSNLGITVGNNIWVNVPGETVGVEHKASFIGPQVGLFSSTKLSDKLALRLELQYSYLISANDKLEDAQSYDLESYFYNSDFHQFRLPAQIVFNTGRLKPALGLFYSISIASEKYTDDIGGFAIGGEVNDEYTHRIMQFGGSIGASYELSEKWSFSVNYLMGFNRPDLKFSSKRDDVSISNYTNISPRSHQINLGLAYTL